MDFVGTVDGEAFEGGEARGHVTELGSGRLIDDFEQQLEGASAGEERDRHGHVPRRLPGRAPGRQGGRPSPSRSRRSRRSACRSSTTSSPRRPAATTRSTSCARRSSSGCSEADEQAIEGEFRQAAVDAVVADARSRSRTSWCTPSRTRCGTAPRGGCSQQGVDPSQYLQLSGKTEEELVTEAEPDAEQALKREAVLAAIVEAEGIEVSDEEIAEAMREAAGPEASDKQVQRALKRARAQGAEEALREDIAMRKAVDLVVEQRQGDHRRAGAGAREAVDARRRRGRRAGLRQAVDARLLSIARLARP